MDRSSKIRQIVDDCLKRREAGERLSDDAVISSNQDLMPQLGEELQRVHIQYARAQADGLDSSPVFGETPASILTDVAMDIAIPGYEIVREIHRGGQGVVYLALQKATNRKVAIKIMREGRFGGRNKQRFEREVQILAQLNHPHIVTIHDSGCFDGCFYFVMAYIPGQPLDDYIEQKRTAARGSSDLGADFPTPPGSSSVTKVPSFESVHDVMRLFARICDAVQAAHLCGVVHRDLKPSNIRVNLNGEPHILDFGLAKMAPQELLEAKSAPTMTIEGQFVGSLPWASPEQAEGITSKIDSRTDVYSLGVILYQMLTGTFPYTVTGKMRDIIENIIHNEPARPSTFDRHIDNEVETIILKCLNKESDRRYKDAGELSNDIKRYLDGEPISAKRDSFVYFAKKRIRRAVQHHPAISLAVVTIVSTLIAVFLADPIIEQWTPLNRLYEQSIANASANPSNNAMERVRVIGITDRTPMVEIARRCNIPEYDPVDRASQRRLHGALMIRLARVDPRVVCFDLKFRKASTHDADFVRGVESLKSKGIPVIVAAPEWWADRNDGPEMSQDIARITRWGTIGGSHDVVPWQVDLIMQRGVQDPLPSLGLETVSAFRQPKGEASYVLDTEGRHVFIRYLTPEARRANEQIGLADPDSIVLGAFTVIEPSSALVKSPGLRGNDVVGVHLRNMPPDDFLAASTVDYGDIFSATDDQLHEWFHDRAVVIGDMRGTEDLHPYGPDRMIFGAYAHAMLIDSLLRELYVPGSRQGPLKVSRIMDRGIFAILGVGVAFLAGRRRIVWALGVATVACIFSIIVGTQYHFLWNPLGALVALVVALKLAAGVRRQAMQLSA